MKKNGFCFIFLLFFFFVSAQEIQPKNSEENISEPELVPVDQAAAQNNDSVANGVVNDSQQSEKRSEPQQEQPELQEEPKTLEQPKTEQFYFDNGDVEDKEIEPEMESDAKKGAKDTKYRNELSTSKLPFVYTGLPTTAYGNGMFMGGGTSDESGFYIDGIRVPFNFHTLTEKPVINVNLLAEPYFFTGAFGVETGDSIGGVLNTNFKEIRSDRIGGEFDLSLYGVSFFAEGPVSKKAGFFSASFDYGANSLYTGLVYDKQHSIASQGNINGHVRYLHLINSENSLTFTFVGAKDSFSYLSNGKKGVPNFTETLAPNIMFMLGKVDYDYKNDRFNSRLTADFVISDYEYRFYNLKNNLRNINTRFGLQEHASFKINSFNEIDGGVVINGESYSINYNSAILPREGEPSFLRASENPDSVDGKLGFLPSLYLKYRFKGFGLELVPGVHLSGFVNSLGKFSGSADPRVFIAQELAKPLKIYVSGGLYSKRPEFEFSGKKDGNESLKYEKAAHLRFGFALAHSGFFADLSGFYKYLYDLIRRIEGSDDDFANTGRGWAAGAEVKIGYKDKNLDIWASYGYTKSRRKDNSFSSYRAADGDIPHIFKAAALYHFLEHWNLSGDISVRSGSLVSEYSGVTYLADSGIYVPSSDIGKINSVRLSNSFSYGLRLEYLFFPKHITVGLYGDVRGSNTKFEIVCNGVFSECGSLYAAPVLATVGIRGDF